MQIDRAITVTIDVSCATVISVSPSDGAQAKIAKLSSLRFAAYRYLPSADTARPDAQRSGHFVRSPYANS